MKTGSRLLIILFLLSLASFFLSLRIGSVQLGWGELWQAVAGNGFNHQLLFELRLPRALNAFATGALLAVSGALMQVLLRNPLADPYVLGISGGAGVAALCSMLIGFEWAAVAGAAFCGALLSMLLVFGLSGFDKSSSQSRLLLTGIITASGWGALITLILAISPDAKLRSMLFWLMGDIDSPASPLFGLGALAAGVLVTLPVARELNVLARGDGVAQSLGVQVPRLRLRIYLTAALLTSVAVMISGAIGFVGLIAPHLLRLAGAQDHRTLLPGATLLGGTLILAADALARTLIAPQQLPVGAVVALIGVPLFLYLLSRGNR